LTREESEKVYRLANILTKAEFTFNDKAYALKWLHTPLAHFNNEAPMSLLYSEIGAKEVEQLLDQIEYGIYT